MLVYPMCYAFIMGAFPNITFVRMPASLCTALHEIASKSELIPVSKAVRRFPADGQLNRHRRWIRSQNDESAVRESPTAERSPDDCPFRLMNGRRQSLALQSDRMPGRPSHSSMAASISSAIFCGRDINEMPRNRVSETINARAPS